MRREAFGFGVLGLLFLVGSLVWGVEVGNQVFSASEAWAVGLAQPFALAGALMVVLSIFLFRGALWPQWPIVLWCPLSIGVNILNSVFRDYQPFPVSEFLVEGIPVMVFWLWATNRMFFKKQ